MAGPLVASGLVIDVRLMDSEGGSMPPSDDEEWVLEIGYGENAASSVAYAIRTWLTAEREGRIWAGQFSLNRGGGGRWAKQKIHPQLVPLRSKVVPSS
ncbi:hypothetical protein QFZ30_000820 [Arthrobacter pascens]|uniref:hypothetical protein n=1 Tax=Arthrobacter pascens TaxID=1677 RepID=UPI00278F463E|nr:hypothetical protein [Arthrobacter pascens]MDQ0677438.1 hypothetical protein [Arthrobacter pascens]